MILSPVVNTDAKMPKPVFNALGLHETFCAVSRIETVTEESVKKYLQTHHGDAIASQFRPEYLLSSRAP